MGSVTLVDEQLGRVVEKLESMKVYENTLIIISSDHGEHMGDHHMQQKSFFYDCASRVPLIFAGPRIPAGKVITENVSHIDLMPTVLEYCELAGSHLLDADGTHVNTRSDFGDANSLVPLLQEKDAPHLTERIIVSESGMHGQHIMLEKGPGKYHKQSYPQKGKWWPVFK